MVSASFLSFFLLISFAGVAFAHLPFASAATLEISTANGGTVCPADLGGVWDGVSTCTLSSGNVGSVYTPGTLQIDSGVTIVIPNGVTVGEWYGINSYGNIQINGTLNMDGSPFKNYGTIYILGLFYANCFTWNYATIDNYGTLEPGSGGIFYNVGTINNYGTFNNIGVGVENEVGGTIIDYGLGTVTDLRNLDNYGTISSSLAVAPTVTTTTTETDTTTATIISTTVSIPPPVTTTTTSVTTSFVPTTTTESTTLTTTATSVSTTVSSTTTTETDTTTTTLTTISSTTTTETMSVLLPTSSSLTCNTNGVGFNHGSLQNDPHQQVIQCQDVISSSDQGLLQGSVTWSSGSGGAFSNEQCTQRGPNNQVVCQADYSPSTVSNAEVTISASYSGDDGHSSSTGSYSLFVGKSNSQAVALSLVCNNAFVNVGDQLSCAATVSAANGIAPTGSVAFSSSDSGTFSRVSCNSNNHDSPNGELICTANYSPASSGENTVSASYSGDGSHTTGSGSFTVFAQDSSSFLGRNVQEVLVLGGSTLVAAAPIALLGMKRRGAKGSTNSI